MLTPATSTASFDFAARQRRLRRALGQRHLAALLVTNSVNIAYLTGFRGSAGVALFGQANSALWVDPRYTLQAKQDAKGVEVFEATRRPLEAAGAWLVSHGPGPTGVDDSHLTARDFDNLQRFTHRRVRFQPAAGTIEDLRVIKDRDEVEKIREAGKVTAEALEEIVPLVVPGTSETDLAAEIEYRMRRRGAEGAAFETIVATGVRGAFPHARASRKLLEKFDLVIIDVGAIVNGYVADMTRTFFLGKPDLRTRRRYNAVLEAQERGINALGCGVRVSEVDSATRSVLKRRNLDQYFTHSTGHGVGLEVHERPRLARNEKGRLAAGYVVTVEPGIYIEGFGGIRIEDTVWVGPDGPEILTLASKTNWILD